MEKIELLSVDLLDRYREIVIQFEDLARRVNQGIGWHYLLDLPWAVNELSSIITLSSIVIDAGAGYGLVQWYLAQRGVDVISVDTRSRYDLPEHFLKQFTISAWREGDFPSSRPALREFLPSRASASWPKWPKEFLRNLRRLLISFGSATEGTVFIYNQDLKNLEDISDDSIDAVVSISALEHNSPEDLRRIVNELLRVLKPEKKIVATLGAARDKDWYHKPSQGWCYSEQTLREIFQLSSDCSSNYDQFDRLFDALCNCDELRDKLDPFYLKRGNHGMPLGKWSPEYHVVGVVKCKPGR